MQLVTLSAAGIAVLLLAGPAGAKPKTIAPEKMPAAKVGEDPYRFNGVVVAGDSRGSGFCAGHPNTFFSAAHVVHDKEGWGPPPLWFPGVHAETLDDEEAVRARGYFRWNQYADFADRTDSGESFSKDVILAYSFKRLIKGRPAQLDLSGAEALRRGDPCMITGYPARDSYRSKDIEGYYLHRTSRARIGFSPFRGDALRARLITTGEGNSGGPVWTGGERTGWQASGVLTGGLPSETIVYGFSGKTAKLYDAALAVIGGESPGRLHAGGVDASSLMFVRRGPQELPDAAEKWTRITQPVNAFDVKAGVGRALVSLMISTPHRGDLQVALQAPDGTMVLLHNEEGAGRDDLRITNGNITKFVQGSPANGPWTLMVRDRIPGDRAVFRWFRIEIVPGAATDDGTGGGEGEGSGTP
jgi:subtilisin-like proprotein convertase family protein